MAPTPGPTARVQRLTSLAAIVFVAVAIGASFGRVFEGGAATARLLGMAVASALLAWALERRSLLLATLASGALVIVGLGLAVFFPTTWFGLPTMQTLHAMGEAAVQVGEQARLQIAPAPAVTPLLFAATTAAWAAVFSCHSLAFRAGSPLLSLVPPAALVVFADSVLEDRVRPMYGVLFLLAALGVLFADSLRRVQGWGPIWSGPGRRDRLLPAAGRGARRIAGAAVAVAVAVPLIVPGFGGRAVLDLSAINGQTGVRVSALVSMAGELTRGDPQEVFLVKSDQPSYWRMTALDKFDGIEWRSSDGTSVPVSAGQTLGTPPEGETISQTFEITNELLFQWLPTAYQASSISLDGDVSWFPGTQTAVIDGFLEPGDSYTVTSVFVEPTPAQLRRVPFAAAPDPSLTVIPQAISAQLQSIARRWTADAHTMYDKVYAIQEHLLHDGYHYKTDVSLREDAQSITEFLQITKQGFCQQFATAMAVLLRSLDIPARVAVGFTPGQELATAQEWRVTTDDFHAWVEVPFAEYGWLAFEPTPNRSNPTAATYAGRKTDLGCDARHGTCTFDDPTSGNGTPGSNDVPGGHKHGTGLEGEPVPPGPSITETLDAPSSSSGWIAVALIIAAVLAISAIALLPLFRRLRRRRAIARAGPSPRAVVLAIYDACCRDTRDLGSPRRLGETPDEYAWRLSAIIPDATDAIGRLSSLAERAAYAPRELSRDDVLDATADARAIVRGLAATRAWRDRLPRRRTAA